MDRGSAGLWTVWAVSVLLAVTLTAMSWAGAAATRQRADNVADLAALAAARDLGRGGAGCPSAARVAETMAASVRECEPLADGSVLVLVEQPLTVSWLRRLGLPPAQGQARAGPAAQAPR